MMNLHKRIQARETETRVAGQRIIASRRLLIKAVRREASSPLVLATAFGVGLMAGRARNPKHSKSISFSSSMLQRLPILLSGLPFGLGTLASALLVR